MLRKLFFVSMGHVSLGLGLIGVFLPILPTTPFIILACGCYSQSSPTFHYHLLNGRLTGPLLKNWQRNRSISRRSKYSAVIMLSAAIAFAVTIVPLITKIVLIITGIAVSVYISTRPTPVQ